MQPAVDLAAIAYQQTQKTMIAVALATLALLAICFVTIHAGAIHIPPGVAIDILAAQFGLGRIDADLQAVTP